MVRLGICSKGEWPLVIFDDDTVDRERYFKGVLPIALKYASTMFGNDRIFQQDASKPHVHINTQEWYGRKFPSFIDKDHWPLNNHDLYRLDYCVWNEPAQAIKWHTVQSRKTLVVALKCADRENSQDLIVENCSSLANRLSQDGENSLK